MKKVEVISVEDNLNPKFVKTELLRCTRDGEPFLWERIKSHDSVHVLVDNAETAELLLVKQVRVPVLVNDASQNGEVIEACAGLVDKKANVQQIAKEEILEELGYDVPTEDVLLLKSLKSSVGTGGTNSYAFIARVDESMKVSEGGGLDSEDIEVVRIPYAEVDEYFFDSEIHTDAITMFLATYWLFNMYVDKEVQNSFNNISNSTITL